MKIKKKRKQKEKKGSCSQPEKDKLIRTILIIPRFRAKILHAVPFCDEITDRQDRYSSPTARAIQNCVTSNRLDSDYISG